METEKTYLAHRRHTAEGVWAEQSVREHLKGVAGLASEFAACFGGEEQAYRVGLCHDFGKYSDLFQLRLLGSAVQVDHSTAGAKELLALGDVCGAMAVAGHHGGLPDYGTRSDTAEADTLLGRGKRAVPDYSTAAGEISLPAASAPAFVKNGDGFTKSFYTRMLFSCLVDGDFLDTETFMSPETAPRGGYDSIPVLQERFAEYAHKHWQKTDTPLNRQRLSIRQQCETGAASPPGLFSLTVPTGGGKTAASMAFALKHAREQGKRRIIYVIPYTSIIEQNSGVFEAALGAENVVQHHSGVELPEKETETVADCRRRLAAENWDAPVIMTTAVQFLESLFGSKPSRCRKLHNIANSVVIFDEAQMLPVPYLRPCVEAIAQLVAHYQVTAVLCTATQPSLGPFFSELGLPIRELCPELCPEVFRRVRYRDVRDWEDGELLSRLQRENQALCIVNTRKKALELYGQLEGVGNYHLSTRMTPRHRKAVLETIRSRLQAGLSCRGVSTSLVEAGVDVDFPAVYRELAGMDSIIQAAGRCNREGKGREPGVVYLFQLPGAVPEIIRQNVEVTRKVLGRGEMPDSPRAVALYFKGLYHVKGSGLDAKEICRTLREVPLPMRSVAENFKLIEENTMTVYIPTESNIGLLEELREGIATRRTIRRLEQDAVSVYPYQYRALLDAGCLDEIGPNGAILVRTDCYRKDTGLRVEPGQGCALFA